MADVTVSRIVVPVSTNAGQASVEMKQFDNAQKTAGRNAQTAGRAYRNAGTGLMEIGRNSTSARRGLKSIPPVAQASSRAMNGLVASFKAFAGLAIVGTFLAISRSVIRLGSDAEETRNKFNVTFSNIRTQADATARNLARNYALSREESQRLLSNTGDLLTGFGASQEAALELSERVQRLAADQASFNNLAGAVQASEAITAALLGETERVKTLGVTVRQAAVDAEILNRRRQGLRSSSALLERAEATLAIIYRQSGNAIGDLERSSGSYANQQRQLNANLDDAAAIIGEELIPSFRDLTQAVNESETTGAGLVEILRGIAQFAGRAVSQVSDLVRQLDSLANLDFENLNELVLERGFDLLGVTGDQANLLRRSAGIGPDLPEPPDERPSPPRLPAAPPAGGPGGATNRDIESEENRFRADQLRAETEYFEERKRLQNEFAEFERRKSEERIQLARDTFDAIVGLASTVLSGLSEVSKMAESNEIARAESVFDKRRQLIESNVADETRRAELLEQLETQKEARISAIRKQAAERQKKFAIFETIVSTAKGALQAFSAAQNIPYPGNLIAGAIGSAAVVALGAAKLSQIQSAPTPSAQFGGDFIVQPGAVADSAALNVNAGEEVNVRPVRESGSNLLGLGGAEKFVILEIDGVQFRAVIREEVNTAINSGGVQIDRDRAIKVS